MSRLTELIARIKAKDPQIGNDLEREFKVLSSRREFGLNFERHRPEEVELPNRVIRKGDKVRILPPRGSTKKRDPQIWLVKNIEKGKNEKIATLTTIGKKEEETKKVNVADLIVVAEFQDYIYPGLISTGKVEKADGKPYHTVINGENYHALKTLSFTHKGKIDIIYIDPPYNTGAKDWKYNNDYVETDDIYRHSKWLAFIERRLKLTFQLLNPSNSVLIVTIDEKEYLRLGLLLEQTFPGQRIQMISTMINPKGSARGKEFYRVDEYIFIVYFGKAIVHDVLIPGLCVSNSKKEEEENEIEATEKNGETEKSLDIRWASLLRSGSQAQRKDSHLKFYPILINKQKKTIEGADDPLPLDSKRSDYEVPDGLIAVWPLRQDGSEGRWQLNKKSFKKLLDDGHIKISSINNSTNKITLVYLMESQRKKLKTGELKIVGKDKYGGIIVKYASDEVIHGRPRTMWMSKAHSATDHGSSLLKLFIPGRNFPFPKSLYAVEDVLRFFLVDKKDAIILDFFAGSGTTAHAVMRLNKQDNGERQSIMVTNNEVSANEQKALFKEGLRPGDEEWEKWGICDYITKPRIKAAITGKAPDGKTIKGDYKFTDLFPISEGLKENAEFFTITYETPISINHNLAFERIAPLLWMRAGSVGRRIDTLPKSGWEIADSYCLLIDLDKSAAFCKAISKQKAIKIAFIVTNDDRRFQSVAKQLPNSIEPVRLYESYLKNFQFTSE